MKSKSFRPRPKANDAQRGRLRGPGSSQAPNFKSQIPGLKGVPKLQAPNSKPQWVPPVLWAAFIFVMSTDVGSSRNTRGLILRTIAFVYPKLWTLSSTTLGTIEFAVRKAAHMTEYAILSTLLLRAFTIGRRRAGMKPAPTAIIGAWMASAAWAASDEIHQHFVPSRTASIKDVGWDAVGAAVGVIGFALIRGRRSNPRSG